eukprot:scpid90202/ scgid8822/ Solute carrier family 25 member 36-A
MSDSGGRKTLIHLSSGCVAGTVASTLTSPLDVVKTRMQTSSCGVFTSTAPRPTAVAVPSLSMVLPRPLSLLRNIVRSEGFSALYKGLGPTLVGIAPARAIYFASYSNLKLLCNSHACPNTWKVHLLSALGAGLIVSTSTSPIWVVKTRLQVHQGSGTSRQTAAGCARELYADNGLRSFYRGLTASYAGVCETAFYFVMYEHLKKRKRLQNGSEDSDLSASQLIQCTVMAKSVAAVMAYPHEVVRTRLRIEVGKNRKYRKFFQTLFVVWKEERAAGLYGGLSAHLCRVVPNTAIMFLVYEHAVRWLGAE